MIRILLILELCLIAVAISSQELLKVDPNHLKNRGYGYLVKSDSLCSLWWVEGAYKVMKNTPVPLRINSTAKMWSAKNEYESVIVVLNPKRQMEKFRISVSELKDDQGNQITAENITIRKVEYVKVTKPTDSYSFKGYWPDPLPLYDGPESLIPLENRPFWITVKVPENTKEGIYHAEISLSSGDWQLNLPLELEVWNFALPKTPSMRSGFGMDMNTIRQYENLKTSDEERKQFEYYMESFRDYKISPYNPFEYTPVKENISGVAWEGGFFDSRIKHEGQYSYRIEDNSATSSPDGKTKKLITVNPDNDYKLCWFSKSEVEEQPYFARIECYNAEKELLVFENRFELFSSHKDWKADTLNLGTFDDEIRYVRIRLFPSNRTISGEQKGTVWFDDLCLLNTFAAKNEFPQGNFEVSLADIDIQLDFTEFNKAGKKYFDEFGFTGFQLMLKGLGGGTYYSRQNGIFEGFEQGTDEYKKLMQRYLIQVQNNLVKNGWIGKEYVYWFDEPEEKDYPFVKETNALIKKYAPKITTFLTEHVAGQDISDVTDISCTIWHKLNHDKIDKMAKKGQENWSYLCCWPKSPWISEFIDHDAINLRMWLWASWQYQLKGILIWSTTYWNSEAASPAGYLQNPWEEPMSYVTGYGWPLGKQTIWGNGDGRFFYPLNRDPNHDFKTYIGKPVPSLRLEILRDGIEDYEYFVILENAIRNAPKKKAGIVEECRKLLSLPKEIYTNETTYSKNPQDILNYRKLVAEKILVLKAGNQN